jgi:hypothetical protein
MYRLCLYYTVFCAGQPTVDILFALSLWLPLLKAGMMRIPSCQQRPYFSRFD